MTLRDLMATMLLKISRALLWLSGLFSDAHEWLTTPISWPSLRSRRRRNNERHEHVSRNHK
jgi:hypothetical protein